MKNVSSNSLRRKHSGTDALCPAIDSDIQVRDLSAAAAAAGGCPGVRRRSETRSSRAAAIMITARRGVLYTRGCCITGVI
jgi:hypothetical protein